MGTQQSTVFNPAIYRKLIKPHHARMIKTMKGDGSIVAGIHSCGSVACLFEDLIEIGIDVVYPVQVNAENMDPVYLKKEFGSRLAFWGGIDTQRILPFGTPDEVKAEVRHIIDSLSREGGFVLASVNHILPDVSPENVVAMLEEAKEYRPRSV